MGYLGDLGASEQAERVYAELVGGGSSDPGTLARRLGVEVRSLDRSASELVDLNLLCRRDGRLVALPPRVALEALAEQHLRDADAARVAAAELGALWATGGRSHPFVEILDSTAAVEQLDLTMLEHASTELLAFSVGPIGDSGRPPGVATQVFDALRRGVRIRVVYGSGILQNADALDAVNTCIEAGEEARVLPNVPLTMLIGQSGALLSVAGRGDERLEGVLVYPSELCDRLRDLFEVFWSMAVPLSATGPAHDADLQASSRVLLTCLAAGLTDVSIAQKLGVSQRTVARRVAVLQDRLGARSRFQLGVQATRLGWL